MVESSIFGTAGGFSLLGLLQQNEGTASQANTHQERESIQVTSKPEQPKRSLVTGYGSSSEEEENAEISEEKIASTEKEAKAGEEATENQDTQNALLLSFLSEIKNM